MYSLKNHLNVNILACSDLYSNCAQYSANCAGSIPQVAVQYYCPKSCALCSGKYYHKQ